jgi:outer membrane protein insertion porin family
LVPRRVLLCLWGALALALGPGAALAQETEPEATEEPDPGEKAGDPVLPGELLPADSPVVRAIEIRGLRRVDRTSVRSKIYTQVGRPLNRKRLTDDVKRIHRMGFFDQVEVAESAHADGGIILTYLLEERPTIVKVDMEIEGDAVDREDIDKVVNLKRFSILDEAAIRQNLKKIEELYVEEGHFLVDTSYRLDPAPDNGVIVTLVVAEGEEVQVRDILIVGNRAVSQSEILDLPVFKTKPVGYFSFLTNSGQFKKEVFQQDVGLIQYYYLTKGHLQVKIGDPVVTLSPDRKWMTITIHVEEGLRFKVGEIRLEMPEGQDWLIPEGDLRDRVALVKGETLNYETLRQDARRIGDAFRDLGYANADVSFNPVPSEADPETLDVSFAIQKGELVHFNRIVITGNKTTRDKVVRREMKLDEGELFSATRLRLSQRRIRQLGFFDEVEVEPEPTSDPSKMDVVVKVKERQTGTFQIGAGFSSLESFLVTAQIQKQNFLGHGLTVSGQATLSAVRQMGSVSYYDPYFLDSDLTLAVDLYAYQEDLVDFQREKIGGSLMLGYRVIDDLSLFLAYTLEHVDATLSAVDIPIKNPPQNGLTSSLRFTAAYDNRDDRYFPTSGTYTTASAEWASKYLGSDSDFVRLSGRTRWYWAPFKDLEALPSLLRSTVLKVNTTLGWVVSGTGDPIPLYERFLVGGIYNVRGFERNSIGPELCQASAPDRDLRCLNIGGTKELIFNAELEVPIFPEVGIRGVLFFDAGNTWGPDEDMFLDFDLRTSIGFGFRWQSPVGPLRFEWGLPLDRRPGEDPIVFEFTIGNSF